MGRPTSVSARHSQLKLQPLAQTPKRYSLLADIPQDQLLPLHCAAQNQLIDVMDALCTCGADPWIDNGSVIVRRLDLQLVGSTSGQNQVRSAQVRVKSV